MICVGFVCVLNFVGLSCVMRKCWFELFGLLLILVLLRLMLGLCLLVKCVVLLNYCNVLLWVVRRLLG